MLPKVVLMLSTQQSLVSNLRLIPMLNSSWHNSLAPYGTFTLTMSSAESQTRQYGPLILRPPVNFRSITLAAFWHFWQTFIREESLRVKRRSCKFADAPWAIRQSRSISPNLIPPNRFLSATGCRVRGWTGPVFLNLTLSSDM